MDQGRIMQLIAPQIKNRPDYPALTSGEGRSITYHQLHEAVSFLTEELNSRGIELKQRVAVIMDNGIDMALCALAVSSIAALVPLSPDFSEEQYRFYMELLKIDYLLTGISDSICIKIAGELNIPVFKLIKSKVGNEYKYQLTGEATAAKPLIPAQNDDIAMILYTSGTTSIPKIVPRTQENIVASTQKRLIEMGLNSADSVLFTFPLDRGISLNDMITTLAAGGTVIYAESLQPETIFKSIEVSKPSWILGTPVLFHSLTDYGEKTNKSINNNNLRTIRASGAPLTSELVLRLRNLFGVPVYMGYGMTETGNICSTQNSPRGIKAGSAGVPEMTDVSIMDENGKELGNNVEGEIVVRGPQVIKAYENSADVNEASFHGEWFRTGDSGYIDEDGYLFIVGRYKEIINRGGEKVSPYEVEEAISAHPSVEQAAVFPIPAGEGLEEVGAAVVLKEGAQLYLKEMRRFLKGKITAFKMPSVLYVLEEMPVSDAGKVQRKKLYEHIIALGIKAQSFTGDDEIIIRPLNETEEKLYEIFEKILTPGNFSTTDSFFELGGDSLKTAVLFENIEKNFGVQVPLKLIFSNGSIEKLADYIINHQEEEEFIPFIVPFNTEGEKAPIFFIHASEGEAVVYKNIAMGFDAERPFYGINFDPHGADWTHPLTFEQIAAEYAQAIAAMQPRGPYLLAGQCVGGIIAYETARQLGLADQQAEMLAMFDPIVPGTEDAITFKTRVKNNIKELNEQGWGQYFKTKKYYYKHRLQILLYKTVPLKLKPLVFRYIDKESWIRYGRSIYEIKPYNGEIIYLKPENTPGKSSDRSIAIWSQMAEAIKVIDIEGEHDSVLFEEHADNTRRVLEGLLENIKQERRVY